MMKRVLFATMLCLLLLGIFIIGSNIQPIKACEVPPGYIPPGENVEVFPDPKISLLFDEVTVEGWATATETTRYPPLPPMEEEPMMTTTSITIVWDITVTATFLGKVTVGIDYGESGPVPTRMLQTDIVLGDVNADGKVNCLDLCIIIKALGSCPSHPRWNPYCDLNGDNKITLKDLCIAVQHFGQTSVWTDITTYIDTENHIIYGETYHFSIFGIT